MAAMPPTAWPPPSPSHPLAVLVSGGLDSAVLLAEAARAYPAVHPIYVRTGLVWEPVEFKHLTRFLQAIRGPALKPLVELSQPVADVYGSHWSLTGKDVPGAETPDEAVALPGRNVLLLAKPLVWCHLNNVPELALAPLGSNPFADATPGFFAVMAGAVNAAMGGAVRVVTPYAALGLHKADVVRRGASLPLEHTFSCLAPVNGRPCGGCNKCAERKAGFRAASVPDPTTYVA
jgi:7-cyano-7-deazaguanine synthase